MKFNERLLNLRKKNGWSQEELGYKIYVSRQTVSKWESGQTTPELEKLRLLAKLFEISVDELIRDDESEENKSSIEKKKSGKKKIKRKIILVILIVFILLYIGIFIYRLVILWRTQIYISYSTQIAINNNCIIKEENTLEEKITTYEFYEECDFSANKDIKKLKTKVYPLDYSNPLNIEYRLQNYIGAPEGIPKYEYEIINIDEVNETYSYSKEEVTYETDIRSILEEIREKIFLEWKKSFNTFDFRKNRIFAAADFRIDIGKTEEGYVISNYNKNAPQNKESCSFIFNGEKGIITFIMTKYDEKNGGKEYTIKYTMRTPIATYYKGIWKVDMENLEGPTKPSYFELPDLSEYTLIDE